MLINLKHEADDLGANFDVDLYSGATPPEGAGKKDRGSDDDSDSETIMVNAEPVAGQPTPGVECSSWPCWTSCVTVDCSCFGGFCLYYNCRTSCSCARLAQSVDAGLHLKG